LARDKLKILITGVGGQGTLTAARALGEAALRAGVNAVIGEVHGMAQRGGVVAIATDMMMLYCSKMRRRC
jgi:indolepyruvate ferredoxin oxidoreductase beta subunit